MRQLQLHPPSLINVLRSTLQHLEEELGSNDASLVELKHTVLQIITELELAKSQRWAA
jgi:hypothetical protein